MLKPDFLNWMKVAKFFYIDMCTFYYLYTGPPIFAPENKNKRNRALHEPLTLNFLLYSNPIVENIWIEGNGTLPNVIHDFRISNASLLYTGSTDKGNIAGYDISFETNISTDSNTNVYTIWAENHFGVDFYQFKIVGVGKTVLVLHFT